MRRAWLSAILTLSLAACGSSSGGQQDAGSGPPVDSGLDTAPQSDSATDGTEGTDAPSSSDAAAANYTLTLSNVLGWCTITITHPAGATLAHPATSATNSLSAPAGTVVTLHGAPASAAFEWVPAGGTGGWSGAIDPGQDPKAQDVDITLDADKSITVCCPFTNGTGC